MFSQGGSAGDSSSPTSRMELVAPQSWLRGAPVRTTWSSDVVVKQVLVTLRSAKRMFHGIIASNLDSGPWDWPRSDCPMWVVDGGNGLSVWQECRQRPRLGDEGPELKARRWSDTTSPGAGACTWQFGGRVTKVPRGSSNRNLPALARR
ncbi:hypothetical protein B0T10DRAFT_588005 [Thelonectria olida]|uniref:Uncharacterized protein n=1 Tax=Thelonectria olida TaxID=1576542 RepID=A0A9P8VST4_9HYPO|nr:hypothetical protein B0T10DRAFT_588005 [Thelonectria olida]